MDYKARNKTTSIDQLSNFKATWETQFSWSLKHFSKHIESNKFSSKIQKLSGKDSPVFKQH